MERIPPELGAATGQRHELIVEGRKELLYLLGEAAELEDAVFCTYLYAAFSLRAEPGERLVAEQVLASLPSNSATADTARSSTGNGGAGDHEAVGGVMAVRRRAMEYRSEQVWGSLPVVHVSVGGRQTDGRYRLGRARGVIAVGDVATGLVAVGGVAIGLFRVGGVALGLVALGAVAVALAAVGAVAIGLFAAGAVAFGLTAIGAVTAGLAVSPRPPGDLTPPGNPRTEDVARVASMTGCSMVAYGRTGRCGTG